MLRLWPACAILFACVLALSFTAFAQTEGATITALRTTTNKAGIYVFASLQPGHYHLEVHKPGFKAIAIKEVELNVQDKLERNFSLENSGRYRRASRLRLML